MLILTRKKDESIIINDDIEIKIINTEDGKVRIGIDAPKNVSIYRKELYLEIQKENEAAKVKKGDLDLKELSKMFKK
ncbi:MAG: carbon storage regulator CsrA [Firmicutes bacterium]|jgi:carbon storage regulator|nr:carbon storage regulator CsrA [Bacillota bacterium]